MGGSIQSWERSWKERERAGCRLGPALLFDMTDFFQLAAPPFQQARCSLLFLAVPCCSLLFLAVNRRCSLAVILLFFSNSRISHKRLIMLQETERKIQHNSSENKNFRYQQGTAGNRRRGCTQRRSRSGPGFRGSLRPSGGYRRRLAMAIDKGGMIRHSRRDIGDHVLDIRKERRPDIG